jgi:hypothetical protein
MVIIVLVGIHYWDFNIANEATVSVRERHLMRLVTAECIDTSDYYVRNGDYIPSASHNFLAGVQTMSLKPPCRFPFGPREITPFMRATWMLQGVSSSCTWQNCPIWRLRCLLKSKVSPDLMVFGLKVSDTPPLVGKKLTV